MESNTYVPAYYARRQTLMRKSMAAISASRFDQSTARLLSSVENRSHNSWLGATVGVVTAGDDSQGMNACIRAVVRLAMYLGCNVYYIKQGFKGMVDGGENILEATWISTSDVIGHGGTILKSYKCPSFTERESRLKAVHNLLKAGISNIIAIGGDGTLRALNVLHEEWPLLLRELHDRNQITRELAAKHKTLRAVGIISSIVHDVCGSDVAIGVDSALHRIIEATDAIATTSSSSQQVFVVEVMGKKSGYLALTAGLACDASMIFIPEWPPEGDWTEELVNKIKEDVTVGKEGILVVVSEGATDRQGKPIKAEEIRAVLARKLNLDTRVTVLGHVQRGGIPSASDRYLASRMGAESVLALRDLPEDMSACAIGMVGNNVSCLDIGYCLENTEKVWQCMLDKNYTEAVRLRGRLFQSFLSSYAILHSLRPTAVLSIPGMSGVRKIGVVKIGKTTLGHCCVTKSVVGYCLSKGYLVLGMTDGLEGLVHNHVISLDWQMVKDWTYKTNACLGSSSLTAKEIGFERIAKAIKQLDLSGIILLGGFDAFESLHQFWQAKSEHRELCIPMCMVPVTITNNIPGTEFSVGADSALNEIVNYCDKMKRVARGRTNCVFVVETMGNKCSYLTVLAALCVGADAAYTKQESFNLDTLLEDVEHIRNKIQFSGTRLGLVIRSEFANKNYTTDFIHKLFSEEGKGVFVCRQSTIGAIQMGGLPTPYDRLMATLQGLRAAEWMIDQVEESVRVDGTVYTTRPNAMSVLCSSRTMFTFKPVAALAAESDFEEQLPTYMWWMKLRPLLRILTRHYDEDYPASHPQAQEEETDESEQAVEDEPLWEHSRYSVTSSHADKF